MEILHQTIMRIKNRKNPWAKTSNFSGDVKIYYDNLTEHLKKFKSKAFVETGTYIGNGIACALEVGFDACYSVEIHRHQYRQAVKRFRNHENVYLYHGDSSIHLKFIIDQLNVQATFWLDAHKSYVYGKKLAKNCPTLDELSLINSNPIKNHFILIDDLDAFENSSHDGISISNLESAVLEINPNYQFIRLDAVKQNNILGCYVDI